MRWKRRKLKEEAKKDKYNGNAANRLQLQRQGAVEEIAVDSKIVGASNNEVNEERAHQEKAGTHRT